MPKESKLETEVAVLKEQVKEIKENHLVHVQRSLDKIENDVQILNDKFSLFDKTFAKIVGAGVVVLFILQIILNYFLK